MSSNPVIEFFLRVLTLNSSFNWDYVWTYFFSPLILQGIIITLLLAVLAQAVGSLIGLLLYFLRRSRLGVLRGFANVYIAVFRGTPLLVQILFIWSFMPYVGVARPLIQTHLFEHLGFTNTILLDAFLAGFLGLALNEGAYMAEIVRAGIDSIDIGQMEAAKSLGMTSALAMRRIVLPQALRVIVPPLGNEFNSMLKNTSLVFVIGVADLLGAAQARGTTFGAPLEFLFLASIWYLILTIAWGFIQAAIERRLNASNLEQLPPSERSWWKRALGIGKPVPVPGLPGGAGLVPVIPPKHHDETGVR
jgi:polar amino acid transport system permease protein